MNAVSELLKAEDIRLDIEASSRDELLAAAADLLAARNGLARAQLLESLAAREQLGSTGMGHGVAIPHARTNRCSMPAAVFLRTKNPIEFDAPDGRPVSLFLALIVPDTATDRHLLILSAAAGMFNERALRERLRTAGAPAEVLGLISSWAQVAPA